MPSSQPFLALNINQFGIDLELEDEYYDDKIGNSEFESKGIIPSFCI